jgi:hypothetical protein
MGTFITPEIAVAITGVSSTGTSTAGVESISKFKKSYKTDQNTALTRDELMLLLRTSGYYSDEVAALFVGIAERESNWRPGSINGDRETKDFSFGFLQMNLLPGAHGSKTFTLLYPSKASVLGYKLAYSTTADTDPEVLKKKVQDVANLQTTDERIFIPYNQVIMLLTVAIGETAANKVVKELKPVNNYIFGAWGDYKVGKLDKNGNPQSVIGTLAKVKYSIVRDAYTINTGKPESTLKAWITDAFKKANAPGKTYLDKWFSGTIIQNSGTETKDPKF